jgi:hypothetical protein
MEEATKKGQLAHALPTNLPEDLAEVVVLWSSLAPEVRSLILGVVRSSLPKDQSDKG